MFCRKIFGHAIILTQVVIIFPFVMFGFKKVTMNAFFLYLYYTQVWSQEMKSQYNFILIHIFLF